MLRVERGAGGLVEAALGFQAFGLDGGAGDFEGLLEELDGVLGLA